jgi:hypothetical protein
MADDKDGVESAPATDNVVHDVSPAGARRRWQIGVWISVTFGILGVVMSVLHYVRDPRSAPATPAAPAAATSDGPKERGHGRGR